MNPSLEVMASAEQCVPLLLITYALSYREVCGQGMGTKGLVPMFTVMDTKMLWSVLYIIDKPFFVLYQQKLFLDLYLHLCTLIKKCFCSIQLMVL